MSNMKNRACGGTQDAANSEIAGRDSGIHNTPVIGIQSIATEIVALSSATGDAS
jgi:hypothetical protein